ALDAAFLRNGGWGLWHFGGPAVRQLQDIVRPTSTHPKKRPVPTQTNESSEPGPVFPRTPPQQAHSLAQDGRRGASLTLENLASNKEVRYRIVGPDGTDAKLGWISIDSPTALVVLKRRHNDEF